MCVCVYLCLFMSNSEKAWAVFPVLNHSSSSDVKHRGQHPTDPGEEALHQGIQHQGAVNCELPLWAMKGAGHESEREIKWICSIVSSLFCLPTPWNGIDRDDEQHCSVLYWSECCTQDPNASLGNGKDEHDSKAAPGHSLWLLVFFFGENGAMVMYQYLSSIMLIYT